MYTGGISDGYQTSARPLERTKQSTRAAFGSFASPNRFSPSALIDSKKRHDNGRRTIIGALNQAEEGEKAELSLASDERDSDDTLKFEPQQVAPLKSNTLPEVLCRDAAQ
jgi:hypothetical protein